MKKHNDYITSNYDEVLELKRCGIRYTFVKVVDGITIWKFDKSPRLFEILKNYYINNEYV